MTPAADPSPIKIPPSHETRKQRTDGAEARQQLLHAALRLFSEKGFSKTSTREIALAAGANVGAISYYFGDKAGLYRAAFTEPLGCVHDDSALFDRPDFSLRQSLQGFISSFLAPMKQGELVQQCTRLHFREMLEPTGLWAEEIDQGIRPAHAALVALLGRQMEMSEAQARVDDDLYRLAFGIVGLGIQLILTGDVVTAIRPHLIDSAPAIDAWSARLVDYAEAMVGAERTRREGTRA